LLGDIFLGDRAPGADDSDRPIGDKTMSNTRNPETDPDQPLVYQIRIKGHLGPHWTDWFEGLTLTLEEDGETLLTGLVADQAALHSVLRQVRDLGMPLLSVNRVTLGQEQASMSNRQ
jgi:hypothetical protein